MAGVLLVTGAGRGIGAAIARLGAARGWSVAVNYGRSRGAAERLVAEIAAAGGEAASFAADVGDSAAVTAMFAEIDRALGPVTALVNNAGVIGPVSRVDGLDDPQALTALYATNVFGMFYCSREAIRRMSRRHGGPGGVIVNISSVAARHGGLPQEVAYASSKGAVDSFTTGLAREVAADGIRVVGLRPGLTDTDINDDHIGGKTVLGAVAPTIPIGRIGRPEEIAEAVLFLLSDAASYMTATTIDVSGGR
ncbi:SDR family oxidoreductase [Inquilinus limosus]|uniref:SDR family oxidoreductase n=1 Tax=Inquilinus limosus TaxID=171674 RepID=UPI003F159C65